MTFKNIFHILSSTEEFTSLDMDGAHPKAAISTESCKAVLFADLVGSTGLFEEKGNVVATEVITNCTRALGQHFTSKGGQVVKYLGDGLLVLFDDGVDAVDAAAHTRDFLYDFNLKYHGNIMLGLKIGIEYGQVIEQGGDCYGDAVNVAARLGERAESSEVLLGETLYACLPESKRALCHSLDRIVIKGKADPFQVWRFDWQSSTESTLTTPFELFRERMDVALTQRIDIDLRGRHLQLLPSDGPLVVGRNQDCGLVVDDSRVSRRHARITWIGGQCTLADFSSNGTWVRFGTEKTSVILKRDNCVLHGQGIIGLGSAPEDFTTATLSFQVISDQRGVRSQGRSGSNQL
ncbi:MAG: adenylate/guanylate cyclase domain-containing protein [Azoarcus sp.]|jgi:class 3 adenylate cyclase|nr:adenylate/guanylate cyclase domain-containing protein [Azoarcus sp.]